MNKTVPAVLCLLALFLANGDAVKCFRCEKDDANCMTGLCDGGMCYKESNIVNGREKVRKGCTENGVVGCASMNIFGAAGGAMCACQTDFCNAAPHTHVHHLLLLLALPLAALALFRS